MKKAEEFTTFEGRSIHMERGLVEIIARFCQVIRMDDPGDTLEACIYCRMSGDGTWDELGLGTQMRDITTCLDWFEIGGHKVFLDMRNQDWEMVASGVLYWNDGILVHPRSR